MLGLGIVIPPAAFDASWLILALRNQAGRNPIFAATDSRCSTWFGEVCVNGELKVANLIPPVNLCTTLWTITKAA